ncbi:MAG: hypothetical protein RLZZ15_3198 [Verrucomicrobiota bacterium]|jgi:asparagine synthase (glutamine-hydrolysing)
MSSICGIFYRDDRPVAAPEIDGMVASMAYWRPDKIDAWHEGAVAFGHLALWSTPEAVGEACPFREAASGVVVTADARIDNRAELIATLGLGDRPAGGIGDTELIARSYLKWGDACVEHLIGDFAFALWDPRRRRIFCARDPMGVRSLHYFADARGFAFSTEIKALLTLPAVPRDEDPLRWAMFVAGHYFGDSTRFRAIRVLRPAHTLAVDAGQLATRRYWRLDPAREIRLRTDDDYVAAFEEILQRAVDARLRSTGRVGCMLSGGLDATTLLGVAQRSRAIPPANLTAYTWALREGDDNRIPDERAYVDAFLRAHPVDHEYLVLNSHRVFEDDVEFEHFQDGPTLNFQHCAMRDTFGRAREKNVRALLLGEGGDETASYGAPDYFLHLLLRLDLGGVRREVRAWAAQGATSEWQVFKSHVVRPLVRRDVLRSPFLAQKYYREYLANFRDPQGNGLPITADVIRRSGLLAAYEGTRPPFGPAWRAPIRCNQIDGLTGQDTYAHVANSWNVGALYGIECRFPYLDRRVVEFCVGVPAEQHRRDNWGRLLLRRCADRCIPAKIARRRDKSSTWPDLLRGIAHNEAALTAEFARWAVHPRVTAYLDVARLRSDLAKITELARTGATTGRPRVGMFCRALAVGKFLARG